MRFRFCGDLDVPEWVLKEINTLSKITSIRMKLISAQVVTYLIDNTIDYEKVIKLTGDAGLDQSDIKACIAALVFILTNGAKFEVDEATLSNELQQLGLPKEHCDALSRPYRENLQKLRTKFQSEVFQFSRLAALNWRVDYILSTSSLKDCNSPSVTMSLDIKKPDSSLEEHAFELSADKFRVLLNELTQAQALMDSL